MTIADQITRIKTNIENTYNVLEGKGATLPEVQNSDNLVDCVESIVNDSDDSEVVSLIDRSITSISNENVTSIGNSVFYGCKALTSVYLPNATRISNEAFYNCETLTSVVFPNATSIGLYTFGYCGALTSADFSNLTSIGASAFNQCKALTSFVLRESATICTLMYTNAFSGTPIASGTGYIYVPDDLVNSYKTATNWTTYANQIKPLSEYESEET